MNNDKTRGATEKACEAWTPIWSVARDALPAKTKIISLAAMGLELGPGAIVSLPAPLAPDSEPRRRSSGG
jgi:hypothetical protein